MDIQLENLSHALGVHACDKNYVTIADKRYNASLTLLSGEYPKSWQIHQFSDLTLEHLKELAISKPELIILGTGEHPKQLPQQWNMSLLQLGVLISSMDNIHACGTYNMLAAENRTVLLALIIPNPTPCVAS